MKDEHVISGLIRKRAELSGELITAEKRITQLRSDLESLDATIRIFDPEAMPTSIKPKLQRNQLTTLPHGQASRIMMDILRTATEPLTAREIAERLAAKSSSVPPTQAERKAFVTKVRNMLARQNGRTVIGEERGNALVWRLAQ